MYEDGSSMVLWRDLSAVPDLRCRRAGPPQLRGPRGGGRLSAHALTVFADPLARIFDDPDHSGDEKREIIIGHSTQLRLLVVGFRERKGKIRLINARGTTKRERKTMRKTSRSRRATTDLRLEY